MKSEPQSQPSQPSYPSSLKRSKTVHVKAEPEDDGNNSNLDMQSPRLNMMEVDGEVGGSAHPQEKGAGEESQQVPAAAPLSELTWKLLHAVMSRTQDVMPQVRGKALGAVGTCIKLLSDEQRKLALGDRASARFVNITELFEIWPGPY